MPEAGAKKSQGASQIVLLFKSSDEMYIPRVQLHLCIKYIRDDTSLWNMVYVDQFLHQLTSKNENILFMVGWFYLSQSAYTFWTLESLDFQFTDGLLE